MKAHVRNLNKNLTRKPVNINHVDVFTITRYTANAFQKVKLTTTLLKNITYT